MTLKRHSVKLEVQKAGSCNGWLVHMHMKSVRILTGFRMEENTEASPVFSDGRTVIRLQR